MDIVVAIEYVKAIVFIYFTVQALPKPDLGV
jgi:hypothetical protein